MRFDPRSGPGTPVPVDRDPTGLTPTDSTLIRRSLDDPEVFAPLFDRHAPAIHDYVLRRLGADTADELCAQTFCIAFDRRHTYEFSRPDARPWLYGIANNLVRRHRRAEVRAYRAMARADAAAGAGAGTGGEMDHVVSRVDASVSVRGIAAALAALSAAERDVLLLHAWGDLGHDDIAHALGISTGSVRTRLHRARSRLRPLLEDDTTTSLPGGGGGRRHR